VNLLVCLFLVFQSYRLGHRVASSLSVLLLHSIALGSVLWFISGPAFDVLDFGQYNTSASFAAKLHGTYYLIAYVAFVGISHDSRFDKSKESREIHLVDRLQSTALCYICFGVLFFASNFLAIATGDWENAFQLPKFWLLQNKIQRTVFLNTVYSTLFVLFLFAGSSLPYRQTLRIRHFVAYSVLIAMFCTAIYPNTSDFGKAFFEPREFKGTQFLDLCFFVVCIGIYRSVFTLVGQMAKIVKTWTIRGNLP
jgi:hypothetical protein